MPSNSTSHEVVIIGGGIAGSALASALARGGIDVLLLESSDTYSDRVRGEAMMPWGVVEAKRLGLLEVLLRAGGHFIGHNFGYDEMTPWEAAESAPIDMSRFLPGVSGLLAITHPQHCQTLLDAAVSSGARVLRGSHVRAVYAGDSPSVEFEHKGSQVVAHAKLLVGADGRPSMMREALRIPLEMNQPRTIMGGLLVDGVEAWNSDAWTVGTEGNFCFAVFPLGGGRARLYGLWSVADRQRFIGEKATDRLLAAFDLSCCPPSHCLAKARAIGPALSFLNNETWTDEPFVDGSVLIGDAGGWTDPVIGCGLSSAYRDARIVSEVLLSSRDWSSAAFKPYANERKERLRRLRCVADITLGLYCEFGAVGRTRRRRFFQNSPSDPSLLGHLIANIAGPENQPREVFTPEHRDHVLGTS